MPNPIRILMVDDHPENLIALRAILSGQPYELIDASSGEEALKTVLRQPVDLLLLDVCMPGIDGFEVALLLQAQPRTRQIPIIFVTALATDARQISQAYAAGAVDYLIKPLDVETVRNRVAVFANQVRLRRQIEAQERQLRASQKNHFERQLEHLRLASDPRYRKLIAGVGNIIEWSAEASTGKLTFVSPQAEKLLVISPAHFAEANFFVAHALPQERQALIEVFARTVESGEDQACEHSFVDQQGNLHWLHTGVGVATHGGATAQRLLHGVSVDITHIKQAQQRQEILGEVWSHNQDLRDFNKILARLARLLVPRWGDWCLIDEVVGPTSVRQAGVAHRDVDKQGLLLAHTATRTLRPGNTSGIAYVLASGEPLLCAALGDEQQLAEMLALPSPGALQDVPSRACLLLPLKARGQVFACATLVAGDSARRFGAQELALCQQICAHVSLIADNARLFDESYRAKAMRERLLAVVAHDLRNPLFAIQASASMLQRTAEANPNGERLKRLSGNICRASQHMEGLIKDLMDFSRVVSGGFSIVARSVDAAQIVDEAVAMLQAKAQKKGQTLQVDGPRGLFVRADFQRILQVLTNLLGNAIKFGPPDTHIVIDLQTLPEHVVFSVTNEGPPIAADQVEHIFECFYQARVDSNEGLGLGLNIARSLVEAHQGQIWLRSNAAQGTRFSFSLPHADGSLPSSAPEGQRRVPLRLVT